MLGPLSESDQVDFVQRALTVETALATQLAKMTQGRPLLAYLVLAELVETDAWIEAGPVLRLRDGAMLELPRDLLDVWSRRLANFTRDLSFPHVQALLLGAAWGVRVPTERWLQGCRQREIHQPMSLLEALLERNWVHWQGESWVFQDPVLRQAVVARARDLGEWPSLCRLVTTLSET